MSFCLAAFRSRNETLYLANILNSGGYRVSIINTPKDAGLSCGISVKFEERFLPVIRSIIMSKPFRSFAGIFRVLVEGQRNTYERLF